MFNTTVISATWSEETLKYTVILENNSTGERSTWLANVVVDAGGQFWAPKYAAIPGAESFKGAVWHTSQWRDDYDLRGKRVAMIGTGPSTAQVAPRIQPLVKELVLYQRSATYCMPRHDALQPGWKKFLFKWFPPLLWAYHLWYYFSVRPFFRSRNAFARADFRLLDRGPQKHVALWHSRASPGQRIRSSTFGNNRQRSNHTRKAEANPSVWM